MLNKHLGRLLLESSARLFVFGVRGAAVREQVCAQQLLGRAGPEPSIRVDRVFRVCANIKRIVHIPIQEIEPSFPFKSTGANV